MPNKPLGVARERNGMINITDIIDTCRLHAKGLNYKLSAYGTGIGSDRPNDMRDRVIRITDDELRILLDTLLRMNPGLKPEQLLDRHCEGLGLGEDRYAHPLIALYVAIRHSPIAAISILNLIVGKIGKLVDIKSSRTMDPDNVLIDQGLEHKINRLKLKAKDGLGFTPSETKFLKKHYKNKEMHKWLVDVMQEKGKQLTELSEGSVYKKYAPNSTEKVAQSKPSMLAKKHPDIARILKQKRGKVI